MNKDKVTELLKTYRAYRYAVKQFENHRCKPQAGIANYDAMPGGSGAPELFFDRVGKMADMGQHSRSDWVDYCAYKDIVDMIDSALETLSDEQQSVIKLKWMEGVTLVDIAKRKHYSEPTVKRLHKMALSNLTVCLRFADTPPIQRDKSMYFFDTLDKVIS